MAQAQSDLKQQQNNKSALGFMLGSMILFSTFPLAISFGNASKAPFLFSAILIFFAFVGCLWYLVWVHFTKRNHQTVGVTLDIIYSKIRTLTFLLLLVTMFEFVLYTIALLFIDIAVATILFETWPFFMVIFTAWVFKEDGRYKKITVEKWLLFVLAFIGAGFVVASQSENFTAIAGDLLNQGVLIGVGVVILAAITAAISPTCSLKLGVDCSKESGGGKDDESFFSIAVISISLVLGSVLFVVLGLLLNESFDDINIIPAVLYGFGQGIGMVFLRIANLKTDNLGINALGYATPVVSLVWLGLASLIDVPHFDWLVIGATAIVAANLLLNFKADNRLAYKTLVVALWLFGAIVYLTDGYESIISLEFAATIFILILAFRVDRLVRRTTAEESNTFSLFRRLDFLKEQGTINEKALEHLLTIDKQENMQKLKMAYEGLKAQLVAAKKKLTSKSNIDERKELVEIETQVDELAHSKQQGTHFGEIVAIGFIGAVIVSGLLFFSETNATGGSVFFVDMTSLVIASVAVFLFFNIIDLQNDRKDPILKSGKHNKTIIYEVKFDDTKDRTMEQWVSVVVSLAIIAAYGWLLWTKAVG